MNKALGYLNFGKTIEVWNNYYKLLQNAIATAVMLQKKKRKSYGPNAYSLPELSQIYDLSDLINN